MSLSYVTGRDADGDPVKVGGFANATDTIFFRGVDVYSPDVLFAKADLTTTGSTVVAAVAGKKIRVLSLTLSSTVTNDVQLTSNSTNISGTINIAARAPMVLSSLVGLFETASGEALKVTFSGASLGVTLTYRLV